MAKFESVEAFSVWYASQRKTPPTASSMHAVAHVRRLIEVRPQNQTLYQYKRQPGWRVTLCFTPYNSSTVFNTLQFPSYAKAREAEKQMAVFLALIHQGFDPIDTLNIMFRSGATNISPSWRAEKQVSAYGKLLLENCKDKRYVVQRERSSFKRVA